MLFENRPGLKAEKSEALILVPKTKQNEKYQIKRKQRIFYDQRKFVVISLDQKLLIEVQNIWQSIKNERKFPCVYAIC